MAFDNGFIKHVVDGVRYSAHLIEGTESTWMVKRYKRAHDDSDYVECLFACNTKDELVAIKAAIENGSWA